MRVPEKELRDFVDANEDKLVGRSITMCDPPCINWRYKDAPDRVVASVMFNWEPGTGKPATEYNLYPEEKGDV